MDLLHDMSYTSPPPSDRDGAVEENGAPRATSPTQHGGCDDDNKAVIIDVTGDDKRIAIMEEEENEDIFQDSVEKTEFLLPPSRKKVVANYDKFGIPGERHKKVFYSDLKDVPEKIPEVGGRVIQVEHRQEGKRTLFFKFFMLIVTKINIIS